MFLADDSSFCEINSTNLSADADDLERLGANRPARPMRLPTSPGLIGAVPARGYGD